MNNWKYENSDEFAKDLMKKNCPALFSSLFYVNFHCVFLT